MSELSSPLITLAVLALTHHIFIDTYCIWDMIGDIHYRRCLTTYLGSSATQAICASWQASTITDMPDMVI
jgi:hypothetical protein